MDWISVKDHLPKYGQTVLFMSGKDEVSVGVRFSFEKDTDIWATNCSIYFSDSIEQEWATCKYWMPLPKTPEARDGFLLVESWGIYDHI
jgi:hypothetical protein